MRKKQNNRFVYLAPREGHCQRAWPVLQYLSVVLLRWLREDPIPWSFFFFFFFFFVIKSLLCLKVQKTHAALAMEIKNL